LDDEYEQALGGASEEELVDLAGKMNGNTIGFLGKFW
jgi:hypothetical protein